MDFGIEYPQAWIGVTRESVDEISPRLANSLAAVLDEPTTLAVGDPAPIGIHWCLSPEIAPMQQIGSDGHPARGDFLPPVPLPRRMWAGGKLESQAILAWETGFGACPASRPPELHCTAQRRVQALSNV